MRLNKEKRIRRHKKIRAKILGTAERPRLCVFRSANHIYVQLVDDVKRKTILSANDKGIKAVKTTKAIKATKAKEKILKENKHLAEQAKEIKKGEEKEMTGKIKIAYETGRLIARKAKEKKIEKVVFDRGGYKYHGRVKAVAEGAREEGLQF